MDFHEIKLLGICLENLFEFIWNVKSSFDIWKFDLNLKKCYPVWKFISNIYLVEWYLHPAMSANSTLSCDNFE